jgi:SAM-dependent methyltransferase
MWSGFSRANALNPAQRHRWRLIVEEILRNPALPSKAVAVDLGCGSGSLLLQLRERVPDLRCVGLDIEPLALDLARKAVPGAEFHCVDLSAGGADVSSELAGTADIVICSEVLEHVERPEQAVELARALLRPGGMFVVTVPAGSMTPFDRAIGHLRHYDLDAVRALLERGGLRVMRLYRWGFPFHSLFRVAVGLFRVVPSQCTDEHFGAGAALAFRLLDRLFYFNGKSRRWGRQIVAVAELHPGA